MTRAGLAGAALATALVVSLFVTRAAADGSERVDASHGRLVGDVGIAGAVGMTVGARGPRASADLRLRYLSSAGIFAMYEDGGILASAAEPRRNLAFGIEVRPLFLARWATGRELGRAYLDLLIDSLAIEIGPVFAQPEGARFGARPGLQMGLGFELPFSTVASGPFLALHGGGRWSDAALAGGPLDGPSDRALFLMIAVGWQQLFGADLVEAADRKLFSPRDGARSRAGAR